MKPQQLKGTLVERHRSAQRQCEGLAAAAAIGLSVERGPDSRTGAVGPAEVVTDVSLGGLVHISPRSIDAFQKDRIGPNGKFGPGTYFAAGSLTGETFDLLGTPGNVAHEAAIHGTVMVVDRNDVKALEAELKDRGGLPQSPLRTRIPNADITGLASDVTDVDILVVFMDETRAAAEIVVFPHAAEQVEITNRQIIT